MFKKLMTGITGILCLLVLSVSTVMAAGSSVAWSYSGNVNKGWIEVTGVFTCNSTTGGFVTTPVYMTEAQETAGSIPDFTGFFLYQVAYYYGTTAPTNDSDLEIREGSATGKDILYGAGTDKIDNATNNNFQPFVNGSDSVMPIYGPLYLVISNNSVNSATGTIVLKFLPGIF